MYIAHPPHGAGTRPNRTQPPTAARETTLNGGQCVRQPGKAEGRTGNPSPPKKTDGEGGGARKQPRATKPPANTTRCGPTPPQKAPKTGPPKRHGGTTQPKPATQSQEQRPTGERDAETCRHTPRKKKRASGPARKKGDGGTGTTRPGTGTPCKTKKSAKNTPRQPSQEGLGTAGTRAQHAPPHRTPEPETAGGKRGAHETTHIP